MRIAIFVSGAMRNGLDSATPGEGRLAQQWARVLARNGHRVDCISGRRGSEPVWGSSSPEPNVTLGYKVSPSIEYDLVLYMPWEHQFNGPQWEGCQSVPMKYKYACHMQFSWGDSIRENHSCWNDNHILAYPYIQEGGQFPTDREQNPYPTFALPMPMYEKLSPINLENRRNIMWSTKDVFHPEWPKGHHVPRIGLATINAIKKLRERHQFEVKFLSTRYFHAQESHHARDMDVLNIVDSIEGASRHELVPRNVLMDWFSTSRITAIVSGLLSSFGESIVSGSAPLCYTGHIYRNAAEKHNLKLDTFDATEEEIYDCIERLYEDDQLYLNYINDCRQELSYYSFDSSYEYFKKMATELELM